MSNFLDKTFIKTVFVYLAISLVTSFSLYFLLQQGVTLMQKLKPQTIHEAIVGQPHLLNPLYADLNEVDQELVSLIFRGLTKYNQESEIIGDLAEKWEISEDGTIYTVYLKPNQTFHDGKPITADDIIFTYGLTQKEEYQGPKKLNFKNVQIEKLNDLTLRFILKEQFAPFLASLNLGILPQHLLKDLSITEIKSHRLNLKPIGSGDFKVEEIKLNKENGQSKITQMKLTSDKLIIVFKFYADEWDATRAFMLNEVDTFATLNPQISDDLANWPNLKIQPQVLPSQQLTLFFNLKGPDKVKQKVFRQALGYAINHTQLPGQTCASPLPCQSFAYFDDITRFSFDTQKAQELISNLAPENLEFTLIFLDKPIYQKLAAVLAKEWQAVGLKPHLQSVDNTGLQNAVLNRDFEVILLGQEFPRDPDQYAYWHSTQIESPGLNLTGFENRRVDKALEEGRKSLNREERILHYQQFQKTLTEELPAIFLYQPNLYYITRKNLGEVNLENLWYPYDRFNVWQ